MQNFLKAMFEFLQLLENANSGTHQLKFLTETLENRKTPRKNRRFLLIKDAHLKKPYEFK